MDTPKLLSGVKIFPADLPRAPACPLSSLCSPITHESQLVTSLQPPFHLFLTKAEQVQNPGIVIATSTVTTTLTDKWGAV